MHPSVLAEVDRPHTLVLIGRDLARVAAEAQDRWPAVIVVAVNIAALHDVPADLWKTFDRPDARDIKGLAVIVDPATPTEDRELTAEAIAVVKRAVGGARMNAQAREENAGRYLLNTLRNLDRIVRGPNPSRLDGRFKGMPAIIVGAGPSLDRQMSDLRRFADRAVVIAADTAWRPLASAGIDPHFVVAIDPTPANGRHLQDVPSQRDTWLVGEGSIDPAALATVHQPFAAIRIGAHHPWPWLNASAIDRKFLRAWGSVLTSAFDSALGFGCNPIVFAGSDLAFTDRRPYCRLTTFEDEWGVHTERGANLGTVWENIITARDQVSCRDLNDAITVSAPHLIEFRNWIVAKAAEADDRFVVNSTGSGILHGAAITQASLSDIFEDRPERDRAIRDITTLALGASTSERRIPGARTPMAEWLEFAGDRTNETEIEDAMAEGRRSRELVAPIAPSTRVKSASINLSVSGIGAGFSLTRAGRCARFVPRGVQQSVDVAADGTLHLASTWPIPIDREITFANGGALAWNRETSMVALRASIDALPVVVAAPFRPSQAIAINGGLYWYAFGGGIWQWHPARGGERIIDTPEATGFHFDGESLRLAPLDRDSQGVVTYRTRTLEWRVDLASRALVEVSAGDAGPAVASDRLGSWIARAYPWTERIQLEHDGGRVLILESVRPIGLAWANASLVVVSGAGELRMFTGLGPLFD